MGPSYTIKHIRRVQYIFYPDNKFRSNKPVNFAIYVKRKDKIYLLLSTYSGYIWSDISKSMNLWSAVYGIAWLKAHMEMEKANLLMIDEYDEIKSIPYHRYLMRS